MDNTLAELFNGPKSDSFADRHAYFRRMFDVLSSDTNKSLQRIAAPFRQATELMAKVKTPEDDEKIQEELDGLMLQAQGLMLYAFLENLTAARHTIAGEVPKLKAGTEQHKKATDLQRAFEQVIEVLGAAYNNLRQGKVEELQKVPALLAEAQKLAASIRE